MVECVELNRGGEPFYVNPVTVGSVEPNELEPKTKTLLNVFGRMVKIRGHYMDIRKQLGWKIIDGITGKVVKDAKPAPAAAKPEKPKEDPPVKGSDEQLPDIGEPSKLT